MLVGNDYIKHFPISLPVGASQYSMSVLVIIISISSMFFGCLMIIETIFLTICFIIFFPTFRLSDGKICVSKPTG